MNLRFEKRDSGHMVACGKDADYWIRIQGEGMEAQHKLTKVCRSRLFSEEMTLGIYPGAYLAILAAQAEENDL